MTTLEHQPDRVATSALDRAHRRNRVLAFVIVVLAVGLAALGIWVLYDSTTETETAVSAEIEQLLGDYRAAMAGGDTGGLRAIATDYYEATDTFLRPWAGTLLIASSSTLYEASLRLGPVDYFGPPIVTGEGPWVVSVVEDWSTPEGIHNFGTATLVIVDEGGELKLANKRWTGTTPEDELLHSD